MTESVQVSIIIPVKDHTACLEALLRGIRRYEPDDITYEIIVIDDASRDDLESLARSYDAVFIREETSKGPAHARNAGAEIARGALLLFLDADLEYAPGLMERAVALLDEYTEMAAVSFIDKPYCPDDGAVKNYGALIEYHFYQKLVGGKPMDWILAFTTRNGAVRADAFRAVGGFNEAYTTNAIEDYEFGKRLAARYPVAMSNGPLLYHNFPDRLRRLLRNYWVRTKLFVPFFLEKRPPLDKAMTSRSEAGLRMLAFVSALLVAVSGPSVLIAGRGAAAALLVAGALFFVLYAFLIADFLALAFDHGKSAKFVLQCIAIHFLSSITIVLAGYWGLALYFAQRLVRTDGAAAGSDRSAGANKKSR